MVKIEEFIEDDAMGPIVAAPAVLAMPATDSNSVDVKPAATANSGVVRVKQEVSLPSSSSSHLRSHFVDMGFSPALVDKVLEENGENDPGSTLECLLSYASLQKSGSETSGSLEGMFDSEDDESNSAFEFGKEDDKELKPDPEAYLNKRSYLLRIMKFSDREIDLAFNQLGERAPLEKLVDHIVTAQTEGFSGEMGNGGTRTNEEGSEALYALMDKTLHLLHMGFTEDEVSSAIDNFGPEVSVTELADSILASRISDGFIKKEVKIELDPVVNSEPEYIPYHPSTSDLDFYEDEDKISIKRAKHSFGDDKGASSSSGSKRGSFGEWDTTAWGRPSSHGRPRSTKGKSVKEEEPEYVPMGPRGNVSGDISKPPYFFYGNVTEASNDTWRKLSQFLYTLQPEFINSEFFSAIIRKEGYIHNLPTDKRHVAVPKSPMTIGEALPFTRQWWPSWDTRKQISCKSSDATNIDQLCERLGRTVRDSRGVLSKEQQTSILHQCKTFNLLWVGQDRLKPLEPYHMEKILGYPANHTQLFDLGRTERLQALKHCFQTDTLAYLLSVLKDIYPEGLRVLSIYSGIGGAEIALDRLGIHLKCVVSIEQSETNQKILKRWWAKTEQTGALRQLGAVSRLTIQKLEQLVKEFGGFDLIIGGNPGESSAATLSSLMGMDSSLFFEFVRIVQRVRSMT